MADRPNDYEIAVEIFEFSSPRANCQEWLCPLIPTAVIFFRIIKVDLIYVLHIYEY